MSATLIYKNRPRLAARASTVGPKEGKGPLAAHFDVILPDDLLGQASWELAEGLMLQQTMEKCIERGGLAAGDVEAVLSGDLINQLMPSGLAARALAAPFFGLYGACSTAIEAIALGAALVDGGYRKNALCGASSHFCTAERQYRFPLELGNQRPPSAQWTATAAGAFLIDGGREKAVATVTHATVGRVVDYQITDANHMGAAMAPSVADTIDAHFRDTGRTFADYDLVATGDLGLIGRELLIELLERAPLDDAGVVDEHVAAAVVGAHALDGGADRVLV